MTNTKSSGGKLSDLLAQLKIEYRAQFPAKVLRLRALFDDRRWADFTRECHNLKGTGKTYGYPEVSQIFASLEDHCRRQVVDADQVEKLFPMLDRLQEAWKNDQTFDPASDPDGVCILELKERKGS